MDWKKKKNIVIGFVIGVILICSFVLIMKFTKYGDYIGSQFHGNEFLLHEILLSRFILLIATLERKNIKIEKEYFNVYYVIQIITFILSLCSRFLPVADRIIWLFYVQNIFLVPIIIKNIKSIDRKAFVFLAVIVIMSINVYAQAVLTDSYSIIPYQTIFDK